ncbi:MAG TPA: zinc ribbon domain-containing protein [Bryobacteraceae bacterium]|jgi:hypothetical protein|nr:zinc ribbon domain-containing protein [Bryobacteraceae bacterium]
MDISGLLSQFFGFGLLALVQVGLFIMFILIVWRGRVNYVSGTPIVLKDFRVDDDPAAETAVEIVGRVSGMVSWFLTLFRLHTEVRLMVTRNEISIRQASLSGMQDVYIPLGKITTTICGYQRSIVALGFALYFFAEFLLSLLTGVIGSGGQAAGTTLAFAVGGLGAVANLVFTAIAVLVYFLSKRIGITIETAHRHGVVFKRSVIENVSVDLPEALKAIHVINNRVIAAQMALGGPARVAQEPPIRTALTPGQRADAARCPQCSTINPIGLRFCENCGFGLSV